MQRGGERKLRQVAITSHINCPLFMSIHLRSYFTPIQKATTTHHHAERFGQKESSCLAESIEDGDDCNSFSKSDQRR